MCRATKLDLGLVLLALVLLIGIASGFMQVGQSPGVTGAPPAVLAGDGVIFNAAPSASQALVLANAPAGSMLNNGTAAAAAPSYTQTPTLGAVGGSGGQITYLGSTSGSGSFGCGNATCTTLSTALQIVSTAGSQFKTYNTSTNCSGVGTAASPSVATCSSAAAGAFSCATNASGATCQVNTTAVTANSEIIVNQVVDEGTRLGVTCNTGSVLPAGSLLATKTAGTGFTINLGTVSTNPGCFDYFIVN